MPVPASVRWQSGKLAISGAFTVAVRGHRDSRLEAGIDRAMRRLEGRVGLELKRGLASEGAAKLLIECTAAGRAIPALDEDESYSLEVSERQGVLKAATVVGALRGLETFLQLVSSDRDNYYIPSVSIQDKPRFRWRGLLFDSSRHFQPLETIKRTLDGMAAVKLNVFHWHLTDDQGFRVESRKFPKLHQLGSDGLYYTREQVSDVIAYAAERGIRVMPEFDMPGHATSWLVGYPELGSAPGPYAIERQPGIMQPTLDPTREEVYQFLDTFLGEMAALFPDEYLHIGGDENEGKQWDANPQIQAFKRQRGIKDNHGLQAHFTTRVAQIVEKHGKKAMGWDEILTPELPKGVVVHSWRGPESLSGWRCAKATWAYFPLVITLISAIRQSNHYAVDPVAPGTNLSPEEEARILGGEATMWSEYVSTETIDSRIWPRTAAIAERFWSPRTVVDVDDMYRRLAITSVRLEELGLAHEKNYRMLLRRMVGSHDIAPLETLVSVVEPVKQYTRGKQHPTTMLSPLSSFVDAARPDSGVAREFTKRVDGLLADAPRFQVNSEKLRQTLVEWRDVRPGIEAMAVESPRLQGIARIGRELSEIAETGLEALSRLKEGKAPPKEWRQEKLALLDRVSKPKPEAVEFAILPGVRKLVTAASEIGRGM